MTLEFGKEIPYPAEPVKEGHTFYGWKPKPRTMPENGLITKAQFSEDDRFVEVIFGTANLSEDEVIGLLKRYTETCFIVDRLEADPFVEYTRIIIRFNDYGEVKDFIGNVEEGIRKEKDEWIRDVRFIPRTLKSYSCCLFPAFALLALCSAFLL